MPGFRPDPESRLQRRLFVIQVMVALTLALAILILVFGGR